MLAGAVGVETRNQGICREVRIADLLHFIIRFFFAYTSCIGDAERKKEPA